MVGGRRRRCAGGAGAGGREPWKGEGLLWLWFEEGMLVLVRCLAGLKRKVVDEEVELRVEDAWLKGVGSRGVVEGVQSIMSESASFVSRYVCGCCC